MEQIVLQKRFGWFLPLRLATYVVLLAISVLWLHFPVFLQLPIIAYSVFTLGYAVLISTRKQDRFPTVVSLLIAAQFICEIFIEGGVIYSTGNINSPFSALFLLTIVSAALVYRLVGTLVLASLVSLAYAFIIWLGYSFSTDSDLSIQALRTIFASQDYLFYSIFLHILIFYLVAFISGYLAERLSSQAKTLADTSNALRRARLETDDILRHLNSGLLTVDASGIIVYFNRAAEKILGYREQDVKGMPCVQIFLERMPQLAHFLMDGLSQTRLRQRSEIEIHNKHGEIRPLGLSISMLNEENGTPRGVIAIFSDLTETKEIEEKMRAADRLAAVGELSASIAHEIRNPLAAISGSVELLAREFKPVGENARLLDLIVKESNRLNNILSDFLAYARIGRPSFNRVELYRVVNDVIDIVRHHDSFNPGIEMSIDSENAFVYVIGDEDLFRQILVNLTINACESLDGKPGKVRFVLNDDPETGTVCLDVIDSGSGIPDEAQNKIFQPFYSTKKHGTGLGLSIVHRICMATRLYLTLSSIQGVGTTFKIVFQRFTQDRTETTELHQNDKTMIKV